MTARPRTHRRDYDAVTELRTRNAVARESVVAVMRFVGWGAGGDATALSPLVQDSVYGVLGPGLANMLNAMADAATLSTLSLSLSDMPARCLATLIAGQCVSPAVGR